MFKTKEVPDEMLTFIVKTFIDAPFLHNGRIVGHLKLYTDPPNTVEMETAIKQQQEQYSTFRKLFELHFENTSIIDPVLRRDSVIGKGTYGALFLYNDGSDSDDSGTKKLIKYVTPKPNVYHVKLNNNTKQNYDWFIEFCTFVVVMAILIYIDCTLIIDTSKREVCLKNRYQNTFPTQELTGMKKE